MEYFQTIFQNENRLKPSLVKVNKILLTNKRPKQNGALFIRPNCISSQDSDLGKRILFAQVF